MLKQVKSDFNREKEITHSNFNQIKSQNTSNNDDQQNMNKLNKLNLLRNLSKMNKSNRDYSPELLKDDIYKKGSIIINQVFLILSIQIIL